MNVNSLHIFFSVEFYLKMKFTVINVIEIDISQIFQQYMKFGLNYFLLIHNPKYNPIPFIKNLNPVNLGIIS